MNCPFEIYENDNYSFSFKYPAAAIISSDSDDAGEAVIVQDQSGDLGFQIYITSFNDPDPTITEERLKQDIPDMIISQARTAIIGNDSQGLVFISEDNGEKKREVWFVSPGQEGKSPWLFQITSPLESADFLKEILGNWEWN